MESLVETYFSFLILNSFKKNDNGEENVKGERETTKGLDSVG